MLKACNNPHPDAATFLRIAMQDSWQQALQYGLTLIADIDILSGARAHVLLKLSDQAGMPIAQGAVAVPLPWEGVGASTQVDLQVKRATT